MMRTHHLTHQVKRCFAHMNAEFCQVLEQDENFKCKSKNVTCNLDILALKLKFAEKTGVLQRHKNKMRSIEEFMMFICSILNCQVHLGLLEICLEGPTL